MIRKMTGVRIGRRFCYGHLAYLISIFTVSSCLHLYFPVLQ